MVDRQSYCKYTDKRYLAVSFAIKGWDEIDREGGTLLFFDYPKLHHERSSGG